ncbi:MAG: hypothetical protein EP338_04260 [Bacteroidetes bacterium]|nr:MAG: hypothetical protein EP338_04260 [Bacteroidota bacterium]
MYSKREHIFQVGLLTLLFVYLLLRAWYVVPMHDEIASSYHYFETGRIFERGMVFDANNHFLNSFWGRFCYLVGWDDFFMYRLGNVLAFPLYFLGIRKLLEGISSSFFRNLVLVALVSIPFILEYFAYARGYGMAMAFFTWQVYYLYQWTQNTGTRNAMLLACFSYLTLLANLIFTGSFMLTLLWAFLIFFLKKESFSKVEKRKLVLTLGVLMLSVAPLFAYTFFLKEIGALYYGSLDGLWKVTGSTLSLYVLFYDGEILKYLLEILLLAGVIYFLARLNKDRLHTFVQDRMNLFAYFLFGNLAIILLMALILGVNYPEDRAGMYLVPLFLLVLTYFLDRVVWGKWLLLIYLFFPLSLCWKMSLQTSVFSPDMRMHRPFYEQVRGKMRSGESLALYPTMHLVWNYLERERTQAVVPNGIRSFIPIYDQIVMRTELVPANYASLGYEKIASDPVSGQEAFRRVKALNWKEEERFRVKKQDSQKDTLTLLKIPVEDSWREKHLRIEVEGKVSSQEEVERLTFVLSTTGKEGKRMQWTYTELRWNHRRGQRTFDLNAVYVFPERLSKERELHLYLLNRYGLQVKLTDGTIKLKTHYGT